MTDTIRNNYEVASENGGLHWPVTRARLEYPTGLETNPAAVLSDTPGSQISGTILSLSKDELSAEIDFSPTMVYRHYVRNVLTYAEGTEATFGTIAEGDVIYYDRSSTMPSGVHLSTAPLDSTGSPNPVFGVRVKLQPDDPCTAVGSAIAGSSTVIAVMQLGIAGVISEYIWPSP